MTIYDSLEEWGEREAGYVDPLTAAIELLQARLDKAEAQIKELQKITMYLPRED
jgi:hypothetical protein